MIDKKIRLASWPIKLSCSSVKSLQRVFHRLLYVILLMNKVSRGKPSLLVISQAVLSTRDQAIHFVW